jgi:hypothetical protein
MTGILRRFKMRNIRKAVWAIILSSSFAQASTLGDLLKIDMYGEPYPKPIVLDGVKYTTPALQGMSRNKINIRDVEKMIKTHGNEIKTSGYLHIDSLYVMLRRSGDSKSLEVTSAWKE